ncbi:MAG TPA: SMP-30/gluconolactonase/LRE family protein [Casimicrobiaceae bacterium]
MSAAATPASAVERVTDGTDTLGESPIWCAREQLLYWVDIRAPALRARDVRTGALHTWPLPDLCGAVVLTHEQDLVLAMRTGLFRFDPRTASLSRLVQPEPESFGNRLNETKCDRRGRIWCGTMRDYGAATTGSLYRISSDLHCERMVRDITVPNALCWSPDDTTMYFTDTRDGRIRAYAFDADTGSLGAMRVLAERDAAAGRPDGAIVDADGCLWNARYEGGCVLRITPDGRVDRIVSVPASRVTACALGGPDLRTLYITTARQMLTEAQLAEQPHAGAVFALRVPTPGLAEPRFQIPGSLPR